MSVERLTVKTQHDPTGRQYSWALCHERLSAIEDILGDDYDLDRLRELVEADREKRIKIHPKAEARTCGSCEPKTNADKIRNMTDEELADFIQRVQIGDFSNLDYGKTFCDMCNDKYQCEDCLKLWLKQHVEGE